MAGNVQISIRDEQSARQWLQMVEEINESYRIAMEDAAHTLERIQEFADGTIVDELVNFGNSMLTAATQVFEGISSIADTVVNILNTVTNFLDEAKGFVGSAVKAIFG